MESSVKQIFEHFDEGKGYIYKTQLPNVLRSSGLIMTDKELKVLQEKLPFQVDFNTFNKICKQHNNPTYQDVEDALKKLITKIDGSKISLIEFQKILLGEGEPLTQQEVEAITEVLNEDNSIDYKKFIKAVFK